MSSKKQLVLAMLAEFIQTSRAQNEPFKARAYEKAHAEIQKLEDVHKPEDVKDLPGIGKSIYEKIKHVFENGYEDKNANIQERLRLMKVHGIGAKKASELLRNNITIHNLRDHLDTLNDIQKKGFTYFHDFQKPIPRKEMIEHENILRRIILSTHPRLHFQIAGSYRRGAPKSGDIDTLLTLPSSEAKSTSFSHILYTITQKLMEQGYVKDIFGLGEKKLIAVCQINAKYPFRRLDILMTQPHEYPFALLYFTGDGNFNAKMRGYALERGYSLNEYHLTDMRTHKKVEHPSFGDEEDIFRFLQLPFIPPSKRNGDVSFSPK